MTCGETDKLFCKTTDLDTVAAPLEWPPKWQDPGRSDRLVFGVLVCLGKGRLLKLFH